jgi:very-short-patch-repair endonuclease
VGEFDGRVKYASGDPNVLYDEKRREDRLRDIGFEVVRFNWTDVWNRPDMVAAKVRQAFARQARRAA